MWNFHRSERAVDALVAVGRVHRGGEAAQPSTGERGRTGSFILGGRPRGRDSEIRALFFGGFPKNVKPGIIMESMTRCKN